MKLKHIKVGILSLIASSFIISCNQDNLENDNTVKAENSFLSKVKLTDNLKSSEVILSENMGDAITNKAVDPSECSSTQLATVQNGYIIPLVQDAIALENYSLYLQINQLYARYLEGDNQYFGEDGKYTKLMVKRQRELESFWNMPNEIKVNGQHTATLNNREKVADVYENFAGVDRELALLIADEILALNAQSPNLPENPFFATDGFATFNNVIVIGDGIVRWLAEAGVEEGIVWTGILAHEWAHEVQFNNYDVWYPLDADPDPATSTRYTELEADFLAAYFMTHKRGATYNQKRVEEFFNLFFQIGDCGFTSAGHHGTPLQRMAAANLGFNLASQAQKQGHILTQQEAHEYFVANIASIL